MDVNSASGVSPQFQAAATKTALNVQKQEGNNAVKLIESAVQVSEQSVASSKSANKVDIIV
ncbi:MAG: hypothetical protein G3M78_13805 [Candidatus Nitrohelix vancouverensis]|uniref:Motility protein n=1 Tax=Candidatus Nitrohelix vancouverensis TaxID=2705534 RepID=A0A7T0C4T8_9BACT|nr:MAG: hypothetical protein G3M78_13805 [Candidatus Nitrohelix vancouverensis]